MGTDPEADSRAFRSRELTNATIGMFDLPLRAYVDLASAVYSRSFLQLRESLRSFVAAYDEGVHWRPNTALRRTVERGT